MKRIPKIKGKNITKVKKIGKLGKILNIKTILIVAAIAVIVLILYYGIGLGFGGGIGDGKGDGNNKNKSNKNPDSITEVIDDSAIITTESVKEEGEDIFEGAIFAITVAENDYFYNNERVSLDAFLDIVNKAEKNLVVEIKDDNASLKAYNNLLDKLDQMNIDYIEK
ncbi:MAG: hypothetical protein IJN05_00960 [Ruminococcus sp.]|nr:hypothetical protein [Ruminococcus sp.]